MTTMQDTTTSTIVLVLFTLKNDFKLKLLRKTTILTRNFSKKALITIVHICIRTVRYIN